MNDAKTKPSQILDAKMQAYSSIKNSNSKNITTNSIAANVQIELVSKFYESCIKKINEGAPKENILESIENFRDLLVTDENVKEVLPENINSTCTDLSRVESLFDVKSSELEQMLDEREQEKEEHNINDVDDMEI